MARFSFTTYKNSVLASIISFLGSLYIFIGFVFAACLLLTVIGQDTGMTISEGIGSIVVCALLGVLHLKWAKRISENKFTRKMIKDLESHGLDKQIADSSEFAAEIYQKCPTKKMKKYIKKKCSSKLSEQLKNLR